MKDSPKEAPSGPEELPVDVVGLPLGEAIHRLRQHPYTLAFTAPVRPKGEPGAVRVVAQRMEGGRMKLICAREYFDRPGLEPKSQGEASDRG